MKKTDMAYFAGIFDGEGTVVIYKGKSQRDGWNPVYHVKIAVGSIDEWLVRQYQFAFGGAVCLKKEQTGTRHRLWQWDCCSCTAAKTLSILLPFLRLKRQQAELAIQFQKRVKAQEHIRKQQPRTRRAISAEELALREAERVLMSNLNHRQGGTIQ